MPYPNEPGTEPGRMGVWGCRHGHSLLETFKQNSSTGVGGQNKQGQSGPKTTVPFVPAGWSEVKC